MHHRQFGLIGALTGQTLAQLDICLALTVCVGSFNASQVIWFDWFFGWASPGSTRYLFSPDCLREFL